ncbi:helix-turn-helix domain-containing protein [Bacillus cereus]|uniref:helix-turn-helix domain-containing protein n=1 Tax=Bacillus cereus TaxID=1396 RepID=UPI003B5C75A6
MNEFQGLSNKRKAKLYKENYKKWKEYSLNENGFFVIFSGFVEENKLKKISGNALKLYIYLGMYSKNMTGEVWHSTTTISTYFGKSERTIRGWMKELEDQHLIKRMRLEFDGQPHVFLQPYNAGDSRKL